MQVVDAQREVRQTYVGSAPGSRVSAAVWFASAVAATWGNPRLAILVLILGGTFIFPLTQLLLKAMGRRATLSKENPMGQLAMQIAFTIPASYPLIGAATLHRLDWFYPAFMVVVGAHYLPFVFLYGMTAFLGLALVLVGGGFALGAYVHGGFALGGWITAGLLLAWSFVAAEIARREPGQR